MRLHVVGDVLALGDDGRNGVFQLVGFGHFINVSEHQDAAEDQGRRIDLVLAFVFRRAAMRGLEDSSLFADVRTGRHAQSTHQSGA